MEQGSEDTPVIPGDDKTVPPVVTDTKTEIPTDPAAREARIHELSQENAQRRVRERETSDALTAALAKVKEFEDKDKTETDRLSGSVTELTEAKTTLEQEVGKLRLNNAFLLDNTYTWHDPKAALKLADLSKVKFDDDGNAEGLAEALKALADESPYLLKTAATEEEPEDDDPSKILPTGQTPKSKQVKKGEFDREELARKYPGLRQHAAG